MADEKGNSVWYRLLFTKDDDLDLTQVFFMASVIFAFVAFAFAGAGTWKVTSSAWAFMGSVFATLALTGTPRWVAELLSKSKLPGEVAGAIGAADARTYDGGHTYDYDVRDYLERADVPRE